MYRVDGCWFQMRIKDGWYAALWCSQWLSCFGSFQVHLQVTACSCAACFLFVPLQQVAHSCKTKAFWLIHRHVVNNTFLLWLQLHVCFSVFIQYDTVGTAGAYWGLKYKTPTGHWQQIYTGYGLRLLFEIGIVFLGSTARFYYMFLSWVHWIVQNIFWKIRNICPLSELWLQCLCTLGKHLHRPQEPKVSPIGGISPPNSVAFALLSLPPTSTALLLSLSWSCLSEKEPRSDTMVETVV